MFSSGAYGHASSRRINVSDFFMLAAHMLSAIPHGLTLTVFRYLSIQYAHSTYACSVYEPWMSALSVSLSWTRSESLDKIAEYFGAPSVRLSPNWRPSDRSQRRGQNSKRNFLRPLERYANFQSQSYGDCTSTNSDHRISGVHQSNATRMSFPAVSSLFSLQRRRLASVSKSG